MQIDWNSKYFRSSWNQPNRTHDNSIKSDRTLAAKRTWPNLARFKTRLYVHHKNIILLIII